MAPAIKRLVTKVTIAIRSIRLTREKERCNYRRLLSFRNGLESGATIERDKAKLKREKKKEKKRALMRFLKNAAPLHDAAEIKQSVSISVDSARAHKWSSIESRVRRIIRRAISRRYSHPRQNRNPPPPPLEIQNSKRREIVIGIRLHD